MRGYTAPAALVLGLLMIFAGGILQASGAAAIVFCSVIGVGIVVAVVGGGYWLVQALRHRTPRALAS